MKKASFTMDLAFFAEILYTTSIINDWGRFMEHMDFATGKLTLTENIYNQLLLNISNGTYSKGEKLPSESALCKQYKASRFSVRGALQRLEAIGVIKTYQGRGSFVTGNIRQNGELQLRIHPVEILPDGTLPVETFEEFWQFRQPLADQALKLFARRAQEEDFTYLRQCVDRMIDSETFEDVTLLTAEFHLYLYQHCGNQFIGQAFLDVRETMIAAFRTIQRKHYQSKASLIRWHEKIVDLLRKGDSRAVSLTIAEENVQFIHGVNPNRG